MADNNVLFDADKQEQFKEVMLSHGYTAEYYGSSNHDVYNMFPNLEYMKHSVDFVRKFPVLYPVGIVYRWGV